MVKRRDLVAEFIGDLEHDGHFVRTVAVVVYENLTAEDTRQRLEFQVALRGFAVARLGRFHFGRVVSGVDPGRTIARNITHSCGGCAASVTVNALGILSAGHLQPMRRTREFHIHHRSPGDVFQRDATAAKQIR